MKKLVMIVACAIMAGFGFQSCNSNDKQLQTNVEKVINNSYENVRASVNDKVVTLTGTVDSQQEKNYVENSVRSVKNVKSVVNNITVRESANTYQHNSTMNSDQELRDQINSRLRSQGYNDVNVNVSNGEVTLSGDLKRSDLTRVMQVANESNATRVTNNLNLK